MNETISKQIRSHMTNKVGTENIIEDVAIKFGEWSHCLDNGTTFYNPFTKETSPSIGFSPYDCIREGIMTSKELFDIFINNYYE